MQKRASLYHQLVSKSLKEIPNLRTRQIISLRFGLGDGQKKTLEAIGQQYNITRERVRQIEEAVFSYFKNSKKIELFKPAFSSIDNFLEREGGVIREERLISSLSGGKCPGAYCGDILFILFLGDSYHRLVETEKFYPLWTNSQESFKKAEKSIDLIVKKLSQEKKLLNLKNIFDFFKENNFDLSEKALYSYLDVTKKISQNNLGDFGLTHWPEINPRGAKDKAYIIFKQENKPLHFREVAQAINQSGLGVRVAKDQTIHNELIKDNRFILVGRGTYALREWGYEPGTVRQKIEQLLEKNGPLPKEKILEEILKTQIVKPNTVLINLQNRQYFMRDQEGNYKIK